MIRYHIQHLTKIEYAAPVSYSQQVARLHPMAREGQTVMDYSMTISPSPFSNSEWIDFHGNRLNYFSIQERHKALEVDSVSEVIVDRMPRFLPNNPLSELKQQYRSLCGPERMEGENALYASPLVPEAAQWEALAPQLFPSETSAYQAVMNYFEWLKREFTFDDKATTLETDSLTFYNLRRGVCQDFTHLTLALFRAAKIPARYISGYLLTNPAPGQTKQLGVDATHAWVQLYFPGTGWIGIDPTNHCLSDERYIKMAIGRDYSDVSPLRGSVIGGGAQKVSVAVSVIALN